MPDWNEAIRTRLQGLNLPGVRENEIVEELSLHLDDRYAELRRAGSTDQLARELALDELEGHDLLAQELAKTKSLQAPEPVHLGAIGGRNIMGNVWHDLKVAVRMLRAKPGFSALVIGMLALGVAGNTAIFSVFNGLFLRPLPFAEPGRLMDVDETAPKWKLQYVSITPLDFFHWEKGNSTFSGMAAYEINGRNLTDSAGNATRLKLAMVTYKMLDVLGLKPVVGRNFLPEEDRVGGAKVVMLGYSLWQRLYQGDRQVPGRIIKLSEQPYQIVGVLPPEAVLPPDAEAWAPLAADPTATGSYYLQSIGRLKPGVTLNQAHADLLRVHRSDPANGADPVTSPILQSVRDRVLGDIKPVTHILLGAVGLVLLIACVNVAGLMLVRGEARSREIAIRAAIGASRGRIVRQLLTESLLLAAIGGVLGVAAGYVALRGLTSLMPDTLPRWVHFDLDWRCALFSFTLIGLAAVFFGLAPAVSAAATEARNCLQESSKSSMTRRKRAVLSGLVVCEIALALMLMVSSGLLLQAFRNVTRIDPGFRTSNVMTWSMKLPGITYPKSADQFAFYNNLTGRLRAMPGVIAASAASLIPLGGHEGYFYKAEGAPVRDASTQSPVVLQVTAMSGYFETIGIATLAGRTFEDRDQQDKAPRVAIVNETFLKLFYPGAQAADVLGKRIGYDSKDPEWSTIVGVTRDTRHYGLDVEMKPSVFVPFPSSPEWGMSLVVRSSNDAGAQVSAAREAIRQLDPNLPMIEVRSMSETVSRSLWVRRAYSWLFGVFAAVAILLAAAGIYGVVSFAVSQRTREIGIRMALGARPRQVMASVLGSGMTLVALGVALGLAGTLAAVGLLRTMLFGVSARDTATYTAAVVLVAAVGAVANFVPARRAARVDPMSALRSE